MSIQEFSLSNNQRKRLLKATALEEIRFQDDNGDIIINAKAYSELKAKINEQPIEDILPEFSIDPSVEYYAFSS